MSDDGNNAVFIGTFLQSGDAVTLCGECLPLWAAGLIEVMIGADMSGIVAAASEPAEVTIEDGEFVDTDATIPVPDQEHVAEPVEPLQVGDDVPDTDPDATQGDVGKQPDDEPVSESAAA